MSSSKAGFEESSAGGEHFVGHRSRLKKKFREKGADALADYELLELLLFRSIPRRDTKPLAKRLITEFGSFSEVITAPASRLSKVHGLGEATVTDLRLIFAASKHLITGDVSERPLLGSWSSVLDYCRAQMAFEQREQFRVLFLNKKNRLICDEILAEGTVDHTPVYPREVVRRALELSATALILVHNHPSGDPTPSKADIDMTKNVVETAGALGIIVHDHIIIAKDGHSSLKGMQLI